MTGRAERRARSIKARVLRIALVPCLVVLVFGTALSGYLIYQGSQSLGFAETRRSGLPVVSKYVASLQEERRLTMAALGGGSLDIREQLTQRRRAVDTELLQIMEYARGIADSHAPEIRSMVTEGERVQAAIPVVRADLDSGKIGALTAFDFYNHALDVVGIGSKRMAASAHDAAVAFEHVVSSDLFFVIESVSRAHALAGYARGIDDAAARTRLAAALAQYRQPPTAVIANLTDAERDQFTRLVKSPDWTTMIAGDEAVLASTPFDAAAWQRAAGTVLKGLSVVYLSHSVHTTDLAEDNGRTALMWSVISGIAVLLIAGLVTVVAFRGAADLITRLKKLRRRTLDLADRELPALLDNIRTGVRIDQRADISRLDFGTDEIGQVAQAFDKAAHVAIAAAVAEAETKQGVRAVFLNIAHRSQTMVHRQLEELDQIERSEDNPELLDRLFRLDHLATRARRNAENLITLGGEQVGRQWRKPVSLRDVIRGAISETKHYTRVTTPALPDVPLDGSVVTDVGHLLAELVDNGTSFSPPESRVEVRGAVVGKGVVVEIEDQGLGMTREQLDEVNEMLSAAPDFSFMALAGELRIGLFVVATLAARHQIRVTLRESAYGGIQAIVLLPTSILAKARDDRAGDDTANDDWANDDWTNDGKAGDSRAGDGRAGDRKVRPPDPVDAGVPRRSGKPNGARRPEPAPAASAVAVTDRPPLPTRVRQGNLAPQLKEEPNRTTPNGEMWPEANAERSSTALSALQRGTARARAEAAAPGPEMKAGR